MASYWLPILLALGHNQHQGAFNTKTPKALRRL